MIDTRSEKMKKQDVSPAIIKKEKEFEKKWIKEQNKRMKYSSLRNMTPEQLAERNAEMCASDYEG